MRRHLALLPAALILTGALAGCSAGSPALKEEAAPTPTASVAAPTVTATAQQGATAPTSVTTTDEDEVEAPDQQPPDTVILTGKGWQVAVPKNFKHTHDRDIDLYTATDGSDEQFTVTTLASTKLADAVTEYNSEDPETAIPVHGLRWEGAQAAAYGEREYTSGSLEGIHAAVFFAQLPSGKVVAVQATTPTERFEDSLSAACLNTLTITE